MSTMRARSIVVAGLLLLAAAAGRADNEKGRVIEDGTRWRFTFNVGDQSPITGSVNETERPLNDFRVQQTPEAPESFSFDELGLSESDSTYGLSLEYQWKWATLFVDSVFMEATAVGAAPRDLFIGVKGVNFQGQEFDYQKIPDGAGYAGDLDFLTMNIRTAFTPVTVNAGGGVEFVPWVVAGLFTVFGQFDLDAGPALGTELYEFPPREYVVGGTSEGEVAAVAPEIGLGGEFLFRTGERSRVTLRGNYTIFEFSGSTSDLGVSARNEKDIDLDYQAIDAALFYEFPMNSGVKLVLGAQFRNVEIDALAEAKDRSVAEIIELQEKFNKDINFEIETFVVNVGLRW